MPYNPHGGVCVEGKSQRVPKRKGGLVGQEEKVPKNFGDQVTADDFFPTKEDIEGSDFYINSDELELEASAYAMIYDRGTGWLAIVPQAHKTAENTVESLQQFQGTDKIRSFRCDNSLELKAAAKELKRPRDTSTPGVPQSNGLAERWVRTSKEEPAASLLRGGASIQWIRFAGPRVAFHHNTTGKQESPYLKRHGVECNATKIPLFADPRE